MNFTHRFRQAVLAGLTFLLVAGLLGCVTTTPQQPAAETPVTVLIVRHAEKAAEPEEDPPLTEAGQQRAAVLARMAAASGASAAYATQYLRTQQTVEPLAAALGLAVQQSNSGDVNGLVERILAEHRSQIVVVAGHSDTVPMLVEKLTGKPVPAIEETEYDNLYVVTASASGHGTALRLRYGDSAAAGTTPASE
jgi:broad specificity phosphatase PhoE